MAQTDTSTAVPIIERSVISASSGQSGPAEINASAVLRLTADRLQLVWDKEGTNAEITGFDLALSDIKHVTYTRPQGTYGGLMAGPLMKVKTANQKYALVLNRKNGAHDTISTGPLDLFGQIRDLSGVIHESNHQNDELIQALRARGVRVHDWGNERILLVAIVPLGIITIVIIILLISTIFNVLSGR